MCGDEPIKRVPSPGLSRCLAYNSVKRLVADLKINLLVKIGEDRSRPASNSVDFVEKIKFEQNHG
jgi:hypothetical protein